MNVKPHVCKYCSKGFTQKGNLKKHLKTHEVPLVGNRKRYQCEYCNRKYTERYNYRVSLLFYESLYTGYCPLFLAAIDIQFSM